MLTNILSVNVNQLQTSLTPVNLVHFSVFYITLKIYYALNVHCVLGVLTIIIHAHSRLTIQYNYRSFLWKYICILVQQFMNWHHEISQMHSWSAWCIVLTLCTWLGNWSWNMWDMVNWPTLIKYNSCSCNFDSVWKILPTIIREIHYLIISLNNILYQLVRYRCIIHTRITLQSQSLIVSNLTQYMYQSFKVYFTRVWWNRC